MGGKDYQYTAPTAKSETAGLSTQEATSHSKLPDAGSAMPAGYDSQLLKQYMSDIAVATKEENQRLKAEVGKLRKENSELWKRIAKLSKGKTC